MVRQHFNDAAYGDAAVEALLDHRLQLAAQCDQSGNPVLDIGEVCTRDSISLVTGLLRQAGEGQELADRVDVEAQLATVANEPQALEVRRVVGSAVSLSTGRDRQQPDAFVIPDRGYLHA